MKSSTSDLLEVRGIVEKIVYRNESNGYTVLEISVDTADGVEIITAVGNISVLTVGEQVKLIGKFSKHHNFGMQFNIETFERYAPTGKDAILKYLSSGAIKGVGKVTAKKIVSLFGDESLDVMTKQPEKLTQIKGINKNKALDIGKQLSNIFGMREIMTYFSKFGILPEEAIKIWKVFGDASIELINENPYIICKEPLGLSFDKADEIAAMLSKPQDSIDRVRAGIIHILKHNMNNGHTCLPRLKIEPICSQFLGVEETIVNKVIDELIYNNLLVSDKLCESDFLFLPNMYESERFCADRLNIMLIHPSRKIAFAEEEISKIEKSEGIVYASLQKKAIKNAIEKGLLIMTGGPGTGKTTTINAIIKILESKGEKVFLAAPTGRAANRMSELTGKEAKTIHRLLGVEWDRDDNQIFSKNERNLLECDSLILDELSMIDVTIFEAVLRALPLGCRLIMVGDSDQLPSVGAGNVLRDMIDSGKLPVVELDEIFRQSMESLIITNSHKIVNGEYPELTVKNKDFFFLPCFNYESISKTIVDLCSNRLVKSYGYSPYDIQILSPGRRGRLGSIDLNEKLQERINPKLDSKPEVFINNMALREGDKVMQVKNNYDIQWTKDDGTAGEGLFNGDIGKIIYIDKKSSSILVRFEDKNALYDSDNVNNLELAYAMTIHKSQGSEFEAVIIPMFKGARQLYYRNLLYTGVTRAKSLLIMVGLESTVKYMVDNNRETKRYTSLCEFLRGE